MRDTDGNVNGISLNYKGGSDACASDPLRNYELIVNITCNLEVPLSNFIGQQGDGCVQTLFYESRTGCPVFTFDKFAQFINDYYWAFGAVLSALGFFLAFFGNKFVNAVIFAVVALGSILIAASLFFQLFLKNVQEEWAQWACFGGILVGGLILGYIVMRARKYGIGLLAAWGGVMIGFVITTAFIISDTYVYWGILIACAAMCFFLAVKVEKSVIIMLTSFIGSYCLVRGISMYVGGFPNENDLHKEVSSGAVDWTTFDKKFYYYLGAIVILTIFSTTFQKK